MDLYCCEAQLDFECRAIADPVLLKDDRVLTNLLWSEDRHVPSASYFDCVQTDLKPQMRRVVTEWMFEICEEQQCQPDVYWLSVNYMDRFLSVRRTSKSHLQLLGAVCLFLASKLKESNPLTADQLVTYTDRSITYEELRQWELLVLNRLKWDLCAITPHDFVDLLLSRLDAGGAGRDSAVDLNDRWDSTRRDVHALIASCALEYKFTMYPPSMMACACVAAVLKRRADRWAHPADAAAFSRRILAQLQRITQIEQEILRGCLEQVEELMAALSRPAALAGRPSDHPHATSAAEEIPLAPKNEHEKAGTPTDVRDIHF